MCIRIYIFNLKNKKHKKIRGQKSKETKEEKIISVENLTGYGDIVCKYKNNLKNREPQIKYFTILIYMLQ